MGQIKTKSYFNYFFIAMVILWKPLHGTVLAFDGKGRILFLLTFLAFIVNSNKIYFKKLLYSKPMVFWLIWCFYVTINTYLKGYESESTTFSYFVVNNVFCPCMIMAVSAYEYFKSPREFLKTILLIYLIYAFIGAFVMDIAYVAVEKGAVTVNTLGNELSLNVMLIIFFAGVLYCHRYISIKLAIGLIVFALGIVVITATRKAFGAGVIMTIALILSQIRLTFGSFLKVILPLLILYYGFTHVMNNTQMGERMENLNEQADNVEQEYNIGDNEFLKAMGDRAPQYILGYELFKENPMTGVGLMNFRRESGFPFVLHSEYMVQICECGIIGSLLFLAFYWGIICRLIKLINWKGNGTKIQIVMLGGVVALLFVNFTAWSYSFSTNFVVLGCVIGYIYKSKLMKTC